MALETKQLHRNFQGYCTRRTTGQVYAFGVTAISQLQTAYAQNGRDIQEYIRCIEAGKPYTYRGYELTTQEQMVREVIEQMMCNYHFSWSEIAARLGCTPAEVKAATNYDEQKLKEMEADGLIPVSYTHLSGFLPEWASPGHRDCMVGNNSASVVCLLYTSRCV